MDCLRALQALFVAKTLNKSTIFQSFNVYTKIHLIIRKSKNSFYENNSDLQGFVLEISPSFF